MPDGVGLGKTGANRGVWDVPPLPGLRHLHHLPHLRTGGGELAESDCLSYDWWTMELRAELIPLAFAALEPFPALRASVEDGLRRQAARAAACLAAFQPRPRLVAALEALLADPAGGLVVLEGPPGSGVTSLLAALAARHPYPLWLAGEAPDEIGGLYAQIVALHRSSVPLLDPAATTDPAALERLLTEVAAAHPPGAPVVLIVDDLEGAAQPLRAGPTPLPAELPPGVTLLLGAAPGAPTPYRPVARLSLPADDPDLDAALAGALALLGCEPAWVEPLAAASGGNLLYLRLALARLRAGLAEASRLPAGLDALLRAWWAGLGTAERRLATLLAAAGEPLPLPLAAELAGVDPEAVLTHWERLGLLDLAVHEAADEDGERGASTLLAAFAHGVVASLVVAEAPGELALAHHDLAAHGLAQAELEDRAGGPRGAPVDGPVEHYLRRQTARHMALASDELRSTALPRVASRAWLLAHERRASLEVAREDARWELRSAVEGPELRTVRAVALAGVLATRARALAPEAAAEALETALARGEREAALKRVLEHVERLPDGHAKALILRRLGEICYNNRMRSSAMRLLSRALDLEASPTSRAWRDTRESLLAALAAAALDRGSADTAMAIAERTEHLERRAQIETQVVRELLATGERDKAQRIARGILHESMGAWARAEVAVDLVRAGDPRGAMMIEELSLETVAAWAQIELACDDAARDETAARRRIDALPTQGQRDRGLARLARALAAADNDGAALAAAETIVAVDVRVAALIDLRLSLEGLVAMLALERATSDIGAVTGDDRAPLVAALAAALAAIGRREKALEVAHGLPAGEERDRALARVTVGLAQRGEHDAARDLLSEVGDEDERAWAFEELAKLLAAEGRWDDATALAGQIAAAEQRAGALADLALARARSGEVMPALVLAMGLGNAAERSRALTLIAPALVAAGAAGAALAVADHPTALASAEARGRYLAALAAALAESGKLEAATAVVERIGRPADRVRAGAALARALVSRNPELARSTLGATLRAAAVGREEAFRALELAAPALGAVGGARLLGEVAAAVDEIDRWI